MREVQLSGGRGGLVLSGLRWLKIIRLDGSYVPRNAPIPIRQLTVRARIEARVCAGRILCPRGQALGLCR